jgi:signal transduction histidine kinase/ActR/RegA family two-component response regulator
MAACTQPLQYAPRRPDKAAVANLSRAARAAGWLPSFPGLAFQLRMARDGSWSVQYISSELQELIAMRDTTFNNAEHAWENGVHTQDMDQVRLQFLRSTEPGRTVKVRFRARLLERGERWFEVAAAPSAPMGDDVIWCGFLVDVTEERLAAAELREVRERLALVAKSGAVGVVEVDVLKQALILDPMACSLHRLDTQNAVLSLDEWLSLVVADDRKAAGEVVTRACPGEFLLRIGSRQDGARTIKFVVRSGQTAQHCLMSCRDVSRDLEMAAIRRDKMLALKANKSKSEFISHVSHELRTPLNGVLGFAQLMSLDRDHPLAPVQVRRLEVLQHSATRLLNLVDQLLDVSRIEHGRVRAHLKVIDITPLVEQCIITLHPLARRFGIQIKSDLGRGTVPVRADPEALEQVLLNLLSNAIKYNRAEGEVQIKFEVGTFGTLTVQDTGIGLTQTQLAMLFEPFNRLGADQTVTPGTGLGLVITRKLVQSMGGELHVSSQAGQGSSFSVSLPLVPDAQPEVIREQPARAMPSQWHHGEERRVLYVEDDQVNSFLMEQVFMSQPEWRLLGASTAAAGVEAALAHDPEVVLIDLNLPDASGFELVQRLKSDVRTAHLRCVAVSAAAMPDQIRSALASGFDDFWTKPLDVVCVIGKLKSMLDRRGGSQECRA